MIFLNRRHHSGNSLNERHSLTFFKVINEGYFFVSLRLLFWILFIGIIMSEWLWLESCVSMCEIIKWNTERIMKYRNALWYLYVWHLESNTVIPLAPWNCFHSYSRTHIVELGKYFKIIKVMTFIVTLQHDIC